MLYDLTLSAVDILQYLFSIAILTLVIINMGRYYLRLESRKIQSDNSCKKNSNKDYQLRDRTKYPSLNVFRFSKVIWKFGLFIALMSSFTVMSWTTYERQEYHVTDMIFEDLLVEVDPPIIIARSPIPLPPPPIVVSVIDVVETDKLVPKLLQPEDLLVPSIDVNATLDSTAVADTIVAVVAPVLLPPPPVVPDDGEISDFAEHMPRFPGCEGELLKSDKERCATQQMMKYIYDNVKYPRRAKENGIEGVCVISFVVTKTGEITEVELLRDIGMGCGKAGLKAVKKMVDLPEKWTPGRQLGKPVNVRYRLPIKFKLRN